jgi:hypothetical protein
MDKNAIKKYAVWARNELIARVTQKAEQYEITEKKTTPAGADSIGGRLLSEAEKKQRAALIEKIKTDGFEQVMEEVAYTWFNRFTALRFMEVNNYLPSHTRVFTNEAGEFKPQILADAIQLDLDGLNMDKIFELKDANKTEELYKYLLITQCNALSSVLPRMFQKIAHYTELLLPDYLLREGSVIEQMIALIPEEDWTDQVQIIGWLYQYYNSEPKDAVFAALKKNVKISKENIPAATQLFTPDWIVRYMVENSLGRLWLEGHPNDALKSDWKYYLDEAEQEADVQKQLDEIRKEYAELKPEEIRCIDPCMGSGHVLCYMFDVLVKIYEDYGYAAREAVVNIVEKNLWGLDIDERAAQLSYFAVMMKACQYDHRFLARGIQPHVYAIEESNGITYEALQDMGRGLLGDDYEKAVTETWHLIEELHDAKEYGSLLDISSKDWGLLRRFASSEVTGLGQLKIDIFGGVEASASLQKLINVGETLSQKYCVAVTNPPYMSLARMGKKLNERVKKQYPYSKTDLCAVFIERVMRLITNMGYAGMITQHGWMFITSFEKFRNEMNNNTVVNMVHLGPRAFEEIGGEVVQTCAFVNRKGRLDSYAAAYCRLVDAGSQEDKEEQFLKRNCIFYTSQKQFELIPGSPFAYWIDQSFIEKFQTNPLLSDLADLKNGLGTMDNNRFLRLWYEVDINKIEFTGTDREDFRKKGKKWAPYNKAGEARPWYGNRDYIVNWEFDGAEIRELAKNATGGRIVSEEFYFHESISWSYLANRFAVRYFPTGSMFDSIGTSCFPMDGDYYAYLGLLNSRVTTEYLKILAPTLAFNPGSVGKFPVCFGNIKGRLRQLAEDCVSISKKDWDSKEISWDFETHPLLRGNSLVEIAYREWMEECEEQIKTLIESQREIDSLCAKVYMIDIDNADSDDQMFIDKPTKRQAVVSLISYAVGCMFGRYSLDKPGLVYAGGTWEPSDYSIFLPDKDDIIPICDDEYFDDDIVGRFVEFIAAAFGKNTLEENLKYIGEAIGGKGTSRDIIRNYFINDFYSDHVRIYQKRPIYWMFDSGKRNGFKCLVYIHRYKADTIARIRTDYVHEQQSRYRTAITDLESRISGSSTAERVKLDKKLNILRDQSIEIREFEEKIHHLADQMIEIDLDDGIKKNYDLFIDVLSKIK